MAQDDVYLEFLEKLKADKGEENMSDFLRGLLKFGAAELLTAFVYFLTEQDFEELEAIADDTKREEEIRNKFERRAGVSVSVFVQKLRDTIARNYLFPELNTSVSSAETTPVPNPPSVKAS